MVSSKLSAIVLSLGSLIICWWLLSMTTLLHCQHNLQKDWTDFFLGSSNYPPSMNHFRACQLVITSHLWWPYFLLQLEELMDLAVLEEVQQELIDQGDLWEWSFLPVSRCSNADLFSKQLVFNSPSSTSICSQVSRSLFLLWSLGSLSSQ